VKQVLIVGGGTAGWLAACYLARVLGEPARGGLTIRVIDAPGIGSIGVGEGTFPTIRRTLARIGIPELTLLREADASYKQGIRFVGWRTGKMHPGQEDSYLHPFQYARERTGLDLLSYWLLGEAGPVGWDAASSVQKAVVDRCLGPKLPSHREYEGALDYAYHVDAQKLGVVLRDKALSLGVQALEDEVTSARLDERGHIAAVATRAHGDLQADLYIDCTGFRALLIGKALGSSFQSCRSTLSCDSALAIQVPYALPDSPIQSCTVSTAQEAGWIWDIGLLERRGIGYVFSSAHSDQARAESVLRSYVGPEANSKDVRLIKFEAGYRPVGWQGNCVAIGLSAGFFEPLEATGIILIEAACALLGRLFPWGREYEVASGQFNRLMSARFERTLDFIKLHFCLSQRADTDFWRDNRDIRSIPDSLNDRLERWRFRPPSNLDVDLNCDLFTEHSWQHILYGMGYRTDLAGRIDMFRYRAEAASIFSEMRRSSDMACQSLPSHRDLLRSAKTPAISSRH
jgi:tryptophan halogenase